MHKASSILPWNWFKILNSHLFCFLIPGYTYKEELEDREFLTLFILLPMFATQPSSRKREYLFFYTSVISRQFCFHKKFLEYLSQVNPHQLFIFFFFKKRKNLRGLGNLSLGTHMMYFCYVISAYWPIACVPACPHFPFEAPSCNLREREGCLPMFHGLFPNRLQKFP